MSCKAVHDIKRARIETQKALISHSFGFYEDFVVSRTAHFNQFPKLPQHSVVDVFVIHLAYEMLHCTSNVHVKVEIITPEQKLSVSLRTF